MSYREDLEKGMDINAVMDRALTRLGEGVDGAVDGLAFVDADDLTLALNYIGKMESFINAIDKAWRLGH